MNLYRVVYFLTIGTADSNASRFVVASTAQNAVAAVASDAATNGYSIHDASVSLVDDNLLTGS